MADKWKVIPKAVNTLTYGARLNNFTMFGGLVSHDFHQIYFINQWVISLYIPLATSIPTLIPPLKGRGGTRLVVVPPLVYDLLNGLK